MLLSSCQFCNNFPVCVILPPGRLIREGGNILAATPAVTGLTLADWLGIVGRLTDTAGYGAARAVLVTRQSCGLAGLKSELY